MDEAAVDLQTVGRQADKVAQGRKAGAEIVDGDRHAERLERLQVLDNRLPAGQGDGFGNLKLKQRRIDVGAGDRLADDIEKTRMAKLDR